MIPIFIGVAWLTLVTIIVAACGAAARADAIELEIIQRSRHEARGRSRASCGADRVRLVVRGHRSTLRRIS